MKRFHLYIVMGVKTYLNAGGGICLAILSGLIRRYRLLPTASGRPPMEWVHMASHPVCVCCFHSNDVHCRSVPLAAVSIPSSLFLQ